MAQLGERLAVDQAVRGSKPRRGARHLGVAQLGAHLLWEQRVAGSNPAAETTLIRPLVAELADAPVSEAGVARHVRSTRTEGTNHISRGVVEWSRQLTLTQSTQV